MLDEVVHILVIEFAGDKCEVGRGLALHLRLEELFQKPDVLDDCVDLVAVKGERLLQLVKDTHEIKHEAVRLDHFRRLVLIGPVNAGDGLEQCVVAHRLVEVHRVQDRRVEAGQQLLGDDEDFRKVTGFDEILADLLFLLLVDMPLL